jgi:hypothetical protein
MTNAYSFERFVGKHLLDSNDQGIKVDCAERYATAHGLSLDPRTHGEIADISEEALNRNGHEFLAIFIQAVQSQAIEKEASLLIGGFDWLSQKWLHQTASYLSTLLQLGLKIITLEDKCVYALEGLTPIEVSALHTALLSKLSGGVRAKRSRRIKEGWAAKKEGTELITTKGPSWLRFNKTTRTWDLLPEKVRVVQHIFHLAHSGLGQEKIADMLTKDRIPTMGGTSTAWSQSSVRYILKNKAVIGIFSPRGTDSQGREDYFPAILDREIFDVVQDDINRRSGGGALNKSGEVVNLFPSISYCLYCGGRMRYSLNRKGNAYLKCKNARSRSGICQAKAFPYDIAENAVLNRITRAYGGRVLWNDYRLSCEKEQRVLNAEIDRLKQMQTSFADLSLKTKIDGQIVKSEMENIQGKIDLLEGQLTQMSESPSPDILRDQDLIMELQSTYDVEELSKLRLNVRTALRRMVRRIDFAAGWTSSDAGREHAKSNPKFFDGKLVSKTTGMFYPLSDKPEMLIQVTYRTSVRIIDASEMVTDQSDQSLRSTTRKA